MKSAVDLIFTLMQTPRGFKMFGERSVVAMVKWVKQLDDGAIPGKKAIAAINLDVMLV